MRKDPKTLRRSEDGIALLIAIFVLLLISVVAIALIVSSGTETALGMNYRTSSTVYYAAIAGLEEARGRLLPKNPNYFGNINPALIPTPFLLGHTTYVINRSTGDIIAPWDPSNQYYDQEYSSEFGVEASTASWQSVYSVWDNDIQGIPGPIFKWVRINAATEQSLFLQVNATGYSNGPAIYYDPSHLDKFGNLWPSLIVGPTSTAVQALEITAMAALPNGSKKILQYLVAPLTLNINFPAALTLDGTNVGNNGTYPFSVPSSTNFLVNGTDQFAAGTCTPGPNPVAAIGYSTSGGGDTSQATILSAIAAAGHPGDYTGIAGTTPNVNYTGPSLNANLKTVGGLNSIVQNLTQNADVVLNGPLTQSDSSNNMPAWMSATNPATVVVNGDFTFNGWHSTGYGILLVTGVFTYDPDASWDGIILVIGKGIMYGYQGGIGQFHGAVFLASTVDSSDNPLPPLSAPGSPSFDFTAGSGSYGIYYSSCWINYVQAPLTYKVLSFHEIRQ